MVRKKQASKLRETKFSYTFLAATLVIFGAIGFFVIRYSFAGGVSILKQGESAEQKGANVKVCTTDNTAQGGSYAQLGADANGKTCE